VITRNGAVIDAVIWNRAVPVDGGTHTIVARAPGREPWSTVVTIDGDGATRTVDVPRFAVLPVAAADDDEGGSPPAPGRSYLVPGVVAATAVILGGVAIGLDVSARGRYDDAAASRDPEVRADLYDSAVARRRAAIGLGVGAVAAAGVAGWLWWRERSRVIVTPIDGGVAVAWGGAL
jgi:hypothetical protein